MLVPLLLAANIEFNPSRLANATARSTGNDLSTAREIAFRIFARIEPMQVLRVRVDSVGNHHVCGIKLSGVKFHGGVDRKIFLSEIRRLAYDALMAAKIEEVDMEITVPYSEQRGISVGGDAQLPTDSTVFTITIRRGETLMSIVNRIQRGEGVYIDPSFGKQVGLIP